MVIQFYRPMENWYDELCCDVIGPIWTILIGWEIGASSALIVSGSGRVGFVSRDGTMGLVPGRGWGLPHVGGVPAKFESNGYFRNVCVRMNKNWVFVFILTWYRGSYEINLVYVPRWFILDFSSSVFESRFLTELYNHFLTILTNDVYGDFLWRPGMFLPGDNCVVNAYVIDWGLCLCGLWTGCIGAFAPFSICPYGYFLSGAMEWLLIAYLIRPVCLLNIGGQYGGTAICQHCVFLRCQRYNSWVSNFERQSVQTYAIIVVGVYSVVSIMSVDGVLTVPVCVLTYTSIVTS